MVYYFSTVNTIHRFRILFKERRSVAVIVSTAKLLCVTLVRLCSHHHFLLSIDAFVLVCSFHSWALVSFRAQSYAERLRLGLAVMHGEAHHSESDMADGRYSPPLTRSTAAHTGLELPCKTKDYSIFSLCSFSKRRFYLTSSVFYYCRIWTKLVASEFQQVKHVQ